MSNSGKPLHYLLRASSGSDAYTRNTRESALRNCIGITEDPFDKSLIASSSKSEMAHEITILKESNNKLLKALVQKERECREFQDHLIVSSKTNADLMDELSELTLENQRLKLKGIAFLEENRALYNQICQLKKMYNKALAHSSRAWEKSWQPGQQASHKSGSKESKKVEAEPSESWEEISQKLINQMQEEMMELENFNSKYFVEPSKVSTTEYQLQSPLSNMAVELETSHTSHQNLVPSSIAFSDECELLCAKSLIHHLKSQVEHLRNQTMNQRAVLKSTLEQLHKFSKAFDAARGNTTLSTSSKRLSQPSDELFRAYFTKQLHNGSNSPNANGAELLAGAENPFEQPMIKATTQDTPQRKNRAIEPTHDAEHKDATLKATETTHQDDDKICPICERKFPSKVTQSEFEDHVFDHLDSKNILEH